MSFTLDPTRFLNMLLWPFGRRAQLTATMTPFGTAPRLSICIYRRAP